jgi:dienelactone hydrolase
MDFPGCGDSQESFANNNLSNMLADMQASRDFAIVQPHVDSKRVGLFGWSIGGRLALLLSSEDKSYKAIATWAPSAVNGAGSMVNFLGGPAAYDELRARAAKEGFAPFTTFWGQDQQLGLQFFTDLEASTPMDAARNFEGPLLVLYGDLDNVVRPEVAEALIEAASNSVEVVRHIVKGADHGLGVFSDEPHLTEEVVRTTVEFLSQRL